MLTWATVAAFKVLKGYNGLWLCIAMGCDVAIVYYIAEAVKAVAQH